MNIFDEQKTSGISVSTTLFSCFFSHSTNSGNTSDLFPMSPRTLDSLMHNEVEANPSHLGESFKLSNYTFVLARKLNDLERVY